MNEKISDWKDLYKVIIGDKIFSPLMNTTPWTRQLLQDAFNLRGDNLDSLFEIKQCMESLLKYWRRFRFSLSDSLVSFINNFGSEDLKNHLKDCDNNPKNVNCAFSYMLLTEIYDNMLLDGDLMQEMDTDKIRFKPFHVEKNTTNEFYYFGWDCIFAFQKTDDENVVIESILNSYQFIQLYFSKRGSKIPNNVQNVLNLIREYLKTASTTRLRSARILNNRIKSKPRYEEIIQEEKRSRRSTPMEIDDSIDKKDILEKQKASRAERAARRSMMIPHNYEINDDNKEKEEVEDIDSPNKKKFKIVPKTEVSETFSKEEKFEQKMNDIMNKVLKNVECGSINDYSIIQEMDKNHEEAMEFMKIEAEKEAAEAEQKFKERQKESMQKIAIRHLRPIASSANLPTGIQYKRQIPSMILPNQSLNATEDGHSYQKVEIKKVPLPMIDQRPNYIGHQINNKIAVPRQVRTVTYRPVIARPGLNIQRSLRPPPVVYPRFRPRVIRPVRRVYTTVPSNEIYARPPIHYQKVIIHHSNYLNGTIVREHAIQSQYNENTTDSNIMQLNQNHEEVYHQQYIKYDEPEIISNNDAEIITNKIEESEDMRDNNNSLICTSQSIESDNNVIQDNEADN